MDQINELVKTIRQINIGNGWNVLQPDEWDDIHKIPAILALIHSEVSEALEGFRGGKVFEPVDSIHWINDTGDKVQLGYMRKMTDEEQQQNFAEELADIVIRVMDCVSGLPINLSEEITKKLKKNKKRGHKHGGKKV